MINPYKIFKELKSRQIIKIGRYDIWLKRHLKYFDMQKDEIEVRYNDKGRAIIFVSERFEECIKEKYDNYKSRKGYCRKNFEVKPRRQPIQREKSLYKLYYPEDLESKEKLRDLRYENHQLKKTLEKLNGFHTNFIEALLYNEDLEYDKTFNYEWKGDGKLFPVFILTDLHIGKLVKESHLMGYNEFNEEVAIERIKKATFEFINFYKAKRERIGYISILILGDLIENDLGHGGVMEYPVPVQICRASQIILSCLNTIKQELNKPLRIHGVVGNHGRFTSFAGIGKRMPTDYILESSFEYIIYQAIKEKFDNVILTDANEQITDIGGMKFLLCHGDNLKINTRSPNSIINQIEKKSKVFLSLENKNFDCLVMGHLHTPFNFDNKIIIGGSIVGYDGYAKSLNIAPTPPTLTSFCVEKTKRGSEIVFFKNHKLSKE